MKLTGNAMSRRDTKNLTRFWNGRCSQGLSLMHADFQTQEFAPHRHEELVIAITEIGGSVVQSRGVVDNADTSALLVFNPGEPHATWMGASHHWRYRSLYLEQSALDDLSHALGTDRIPYFTCNWIADPELVDLLNALHLSLDGEHDPLLQRELMIRSFGGLFNRHGSGGLRVEPVPYDRVRVAKAIEYIRVRLAMPISLADLSNTLDLTQFQIVRLFKRTVGMTPHAYVLQLRLDAARRHLAAGSAIGEAAVAAGFYDQSSLTHRFKRAYGLTPLQFAKAART
ncbi:AraC family transcriptional regulator [Bradyrhizobium sp. SZCCHNR2032]|uniref:AraC family transcriptional regulator n=1 Tax=Bradyrhizobium sp. SZCCHNR2032 TaxID=3057384 RepID=UPI002915CBFB|nr:AraC family transcriptional regulator [Bradyrhizobium sp. SZCCHNR2032]